MPVLQQAEPDGYTIAQMPQPVFRAPFMQKVLWDPVRDITPIIQITRRHLRRAGAARTARCARSTTCSPFARAHPAS